MKTQTRRKVKKAVPALAVLLSASIVLGAAGSGGFALAAEQTEAKKYQSDFTSWEDTEQAGADLNVELASEGDILLKNRNNALPLGKSEKKLSLFGIASTSVQTGGGGSGSGSGTPNTVLESMEDAGFVVNPSLWAYYTGVKSASYEPAVEGVKALAGSYTYYNDAAVVFIKRTGSEGSDLKRSKVDGHKNQEDHYLQLTDNEHDLIDHVTANFDKVIVIINSSNAMEIPELEDNDKVDGIVWIGHTGNTGIMALGKILNGEVNPSGRLVDVYSANLKADPSWFNFGDNSQVGGDNYMYYKESDTATELKKGTLTSVQYREGIYVGYKWYETAATVDGYYNSEEENQANNDDASYNTADPYYNRVNGVVYPFGYGLSYTQFTYSDYQVETVGDGKNATVKVSVTVTNDKDGVAGKEVVQLYNTPEYYTGGIEKSAANLVSFAKTKLLQPGESQVVTLEFNLQEIASFDYNDANGNGFAGYELEAGDYVLSLRSDSHNVICEETLVIPESTAADTDATKDATKGATGYTYTKDLVGGDIDTWFSNADVYDSLGYYKDADGNVVTDIAVDEYVTRANFQLPKAASDQNTKIEVSKAYHDKIAGMATMYAYDDDEGDAWYKEASDIPSAWTQNADVTVTFPELINEEEGSQKWEAFMNQLTYAEMTSILAGGGTGHMGIERLGIPGMNHNDGPGQLKGARSGGYVPGGSVGTFWVSEVVIASTWNVELAEKQGQLVGNESLFNNTTGWWGPGANTHRSPFGGRNFEYYSSDGVQGGMIAAGVIKGATSKGVQVYIKHYATNDQETYRNTSGGYCAYMSEQALREIYIRPFELAFKAGGNAAMTAFNRIGGYRATTNYALLNELTRNEFGAHISVITDMYNVSNCGTADEVIRGGGQLTLSKGTFSGVWDATKRDGKGAVLVKANAEAKTETVESPTQWYWVRTACQRTLYVALHSNGMDNLYDMSGFADAELGATTADAWVQGVSKSVNLAAGLGNELDDAVYTNFTVTGGNLPKGLSLNANGTLSGKATETGTYQFTVQANVDYWITKTAQVTVTVQEALEYIPEDNAEANKLENAKVGVSFEGKFGTEYFALKDDGGLYDTMEYSVSGNLPEGISVADGVIYGKPTEAGTYNFTVTLKASYTVNSGRRPTTTTDTVSRAFTMNVAEADAVVEPPVNPVEPVAPVVTLNLNYEGASVSNATVSTDGIVTIPAAPTREGYVFTGWYLDSACTATASFQVAVSSDVTYYAGWEQVAQAASGCNGSVATGISMIVGLLALTTVLGATAIVRKNKQNDK